MECRTHVLRVLPRWACRRHMGGTMRNEGQRFKRRPIGVWIVSVFYVLSAGLPLLSSVLLITGVTEVTAAQKGYAAAVWGIDWLIFSGTVSAIALSAAVCLFLLRRIAVLLFVVALVLQAVFLAIETARTNWFQSTAGAGLVGGLVRVLILVAATVYARSLKKREALS